jgi:hypothetical protein
MVKNDKAARSNEACVCSFEMLKQYEPASIRIEWEDKTVMSIDTSAKKLPEVMALIETKRADMSLFKILKELKNDYEPEVDPFEEVRIENEKRAADRARKAAANAKKK